MLVESFKLVRKNSLRGFCTVRMPSGMKLRDVSVHCVNGKTCASPPSRPRLGRDGRQMIDPVTDRLLWDSVVEFVDRKTRDRFGQSVLEALERDFPNALDEQAAA